MLLARGGAAGPAYPCVAAPVVSEDGRDFGTVCCHPASRSTKPGVDLAGIVRSTARILALTLARAATLPQESDAEAVA
jgi:hypothetical protein